MAGERVIDARQVRAARAMLDVTIVELAQHSGVSESSIRRIETGPRAEVSSDLQFRLRGYFESIGFRFPMPDGEICVCWKDRRRTRRHRAPHK